jgi:nucleoside phosphorylase
MTPLFVFATIEEAEATIDLLNAKASQASPWLYEHSQGLLVITGIGPFSMLTSLMTITKEITIIYNFGLAGALKNNLELGKLYPVASCSKRQWHPKGEEATKGTASFHACPKIVLDDTQGLSLISSDVPAYGELSGAFDLVDMEGYATAFFAKMRTKPCELYKIVSDYCNASSTALIKEGMKRHSATIAQFIDSRL